MGQDPLSPSWGGCGVGVLRRGCTHTPPSCPPSSPAAAATRRAVGTAMRRPQTPSSSTGRGGPGGGGCGQGVPVLRAGGGRCLVSANELRAALLPAPCCLSVRHGGNAGPGGGQAGAPHCDHRPWVALSGRHLTCAPLPAVVPTVLRPHIPCPHVPPAAADGAEPFAVSAALPMRIKQINNTGGSQPPPLGPKGRTAAPLRRHGAAPGAAPE